VGGGALHGQGHGVGFQSLKAPGRQRALRRWRRTRAQFSARAGQVHHCRTGTGYLCQFKPNYNKKQDYTLDQIDVFAAYVIPVDAWYLIPATLLLGPPRKQAVMLFPMAMLKKDRYQFEAYKEAWHLLAKSKRALALRFPPG